MEPKLLGASTDCDCLVDISILGEQGCQMSKSGNSWENPAHILRKEGCNTSEFLDMPRTDLTADPT
jgi:hypothetical protein